jgi:MFS family permease
MSADHPRVVAACVGLAIAGFATFMGMPLLVGGVIEQYGFSEGQGGYVASAEYLGMFAASAIVSLLVTRASRRRLALAGILAAIAGNCASAFVREPALLLALRTLSGLGCGTAYAVAIAVMAGSVHKVRNFTFLIFGQVLTNAVVVYAFPTLIERWGLPAIFAVYCVLLASAAACVPFLPARFLAPAAGAATGVHPARDVPAFVPWICILGVFCFYMMIGAYWAYIERIGVAVGFDAQFVGKAVAAGILLSLVACNVAYGLGRRLGQSRPLLAALGLVALVHFGSGLSFGPTAFLVGLAVVNCFWNFTDIYQLGTISHLDHSGVFASRIQGAQMLAMTLSPAIAGSLLDAGLGYERLLLLLGAYVAAAFALYLLAYSALRRVAPHLAEAREAAP